MHPKYLKTGQDVCQRLSVRIMHVRRQLVDRHVLHGSLASMAAVTKPESEFKWSGQAYTSLPVVVKLQQ